MHIRLNNKSFTIIANDCVGGLIYQKFRLIHTSPTCWVRIFSSDFLLFANNLSDYLDCEMKQATSDKGYAIGLLKPKRDSLRQICLHFVHFDNFDYCKNQWNKMISRVDYDNIVVIQDGTDDDIKTYEEAACFNSIKYKKIYFCRNNYCECVNDIKDIFIINFGKNDTPGRVFHFLPGVKGQHFERRYYDQFNLIKWLNQK